MCTYCMYSHKRIPVQGPPAVRGLHYTEAHRRRGEVAVGRVLGVQGPRAVAVVVRRRGGGRGAL